MNNDQILEVIRESVDLGLKSIHDNLTTTGKAQVIEMIDALETLLKVSEEH